MTALLSCRERRNSTENSAHEKGPHYTYQIIRIYTHDRNAFTQGLAFEKGFLYEGTGLRGKSSVRKIHLETGQTEQSYKLPEKYFGEGITVYKDTVVQLTWRSRIGFVYDKRSFKLLKTFHYSTEGWGLTHDGMRLFVSDGTSKIYFLHPETFEEMGSLSVHDNNVPVTRLNELEYIHGEIYANIWKTDLIAKISPQSGRVTGWINLEGILSNEKQAEKTDVLNGIAYDEDNNRLFITGKFWPQLFEIKLILIQ
jgi:glutamine cyclotransferase